MINRDYTILAIDTSCDETSASVTVGNKVFSNVISSQVALHRKYGGVVPHLAKRAHQEKIDPVILEALKRYFIQARINRPEPESYLEKIDAIAVTYGPGLAPALEVGIDKAKELAKRHHKPLIAVNHMEGHLLSCFARNSKGNHPYLDKADDLDQDGHFLGFLVSGGHTQLVYVEKAGVYELLGETLDDAGGEAFDKVARILNLGYPGGPIVEYLAGDGDEERFPLPIPMKGRKDLNFSFSGLKTAVLYLVQELEKDKKLEKQTVHDLCASFQKAATLSLLGKLEKAAEKVNPKAVLLGGGVISNLYFRRKIRQAVKRFKIPVLVPSNRKLLTDNAAMIGVCAYYQAKRNDFVVDIDKLDRVPGLSF